LLNNPSTKHRPRTNSEIYAEPTRQPSLLAIKSPAAKHQRSWGISAVLAVTHAAQKTAAHKKRQARKSLPEM